MTRGDARSPTSVGTAEREDLLALRERVNTVIHGDVVAVAKVLMAWSDKVDDLELANGRAMIRCPVPGHEDKKPSCRVYKTKDERVYFRCRACGSFGDLVTAHQLIFHSDVERAMRAAAGAFGIEFWPNGPPRKAEAGGAAGAAIDAASMVYGVPPLKIISHDRDRWLVDARHAAMYVVRQTTDLSYPEIGRAFGGRDHTTVLHAVRKVDRLMGENPDVREKVLAVQARVEGLESLDGGFSEVDL